MKFDHQHCLDKSGITALKMFCCWSSIICSKKPKQTNKQGEKSHLKSGMTPRGRDAFGFHGARDYKLVSEGNIWW